MVKYKKNTLLDNRYQLTEKRSSDPASGAEVWLVTDQQTGAQRTVRLLANGQVEWMENRTASAKAGVQKTVLRLRYAPVYLALLIGLLLIAFFIFQKTHTSEPHTTHTPIKWRKTALLLDQLPNTPIESHTGYFDEATVLFTTLRDSTTAFAPVDSLYNLYSQRGTDSLAAFHLTKNLLSKSYAIRWLSLAYTLKPSAIMEAYIARLGEAPELTRPEEEAPVEPAPEVSQPVHARSKSKRKISDLFLEDPELQ